ncbi:MAG: hypothetical protein WCJ35_08470 [Planctomycetota bacterium]
MSSSIHLEDWGRQTSQCRQAIKIIIFLLAAILVGRGGLHALAADPPNLEAENQRLIFHEAAEQARALADQQRYLLVQQALVIQEREKLQATKELGRLAVARERIEHLRNTQAWALGNAFEGGRRGILYEPEHLSKTLIRWQNARDNSLRAYLEFPEHSRGAIKDGRALNFFFDLCADISMSHELWRSQLQDEFRRLDARIRELKEHPVGATLLQEEAQKELAALEKECGKTKAQLSILATLGGKPLLNREHLAHLRFRKGLVGPALVISRDDVMPLTWPYVLAVDEEFTDVRNALEIAKGKALDELKGNQGISPPTQASLMSAADDLRNTFEGAKSRLLEKSTGDGVRVQQYLDARHFMQEVRASVYRLVAARQLADVMPTESFSGQTVDQLLSYMARQGLRFAPAEVNGDAAYEMVFRLMTDYYTGLHSLAMAVDQNDRNLANIDAEASQLMDVRNRDTLAALKEVLEARPKCDPFAKFCDVAEGIAAIRDTLFPAGQPLGAVAPFPAAGMPTFQPGAAVCENYLGERQWRGVVTRVDGPNYWVRILYSHKKDCHVGREYAFRKHLLKPCQSTNTVEVPRLYWLGHQPSVKPSPKPAPGRSYFRPPSQPNQPSAKPSPRPTPRPKIPGPIPSH